VLAASLAGALHAALAPVDLAERRRGRVEHIGGDGPVSEQAAPVVFAVASQPRRLHGWTTADEPRNYHGPLIWSEADCVFRFALELEQEFPRQSSLRAQVNRNTRLDFPDGEEKAQQVDIGVSDLSDFAVDETAYDRFRQHQHLLLVEAKWFLKGWRGFQWEYVARDQVKRRLARPARKYRGRALNRTSLASPMRVLLWGNGARI
jgi:hypothetical protein